MCGVVVVRTVVRCAVCGVVVVRTIVRYCCLIVIVVVGWWCCYCAVLLLLCVVRCGNRNKAATVTPHTAMKTPRRRRIQQRSNNATLRRADVPITRRLQRKQCNHCSAYKVLLMKTINQCYQTHCIALVGNAVQWCPTAGDL